MDDREIEREIRDIKQRLDKLEETVEGRFVTDGLERRLDNLEEKIEGRKGLESDVEEIKRELGLR